ncbi:hypothetical protein LCGC14_0894720 [marine sediment metagenome]|uniref:Portal protein n=1 Tax=marine sediment metagenome TaxID=412755 RepID=A0A0F9PIX7_9ZZZZ
MAYKIPFINFEIGAIKNIDKSQPQRTKVAERIVLRQQIREREDIGKWRSALLVAESANNPDRTALIKIYKDVDLDGHITGIIGSIKNKIKAKPFMIINSKGELDEDKTKLFEKEWYFKFIDFIIEAPFWGYSLVQLGNIKDDGFPEIELIPREYVVPEKELVKKDLFIGRSVSDTQNAFFYNESPLKDWFIFIGEKKDLGLFNKATPHAISKKNLFAEMWEYAELFGMPIRKGHTDIKDPERRKQMETMLQNMGSAAWGVFDKDDKIDFIETKGGDATKTFIQPVKLSNEEISKAFAGQVATFDEKSFVGSAEVQERIFNELIIAFMRNAKFIINNQLIPRMVRHRMIPFGFSFKWKAEELLSIKDKAEIITNFAKVGFEIAPDTVTEETGIKVEGFVAPAQPPTGKIGSVMPEVANLYRDFL